MGHKDNLSAFYISVFRPNDICSFFRTALAVLSLTIHRPCLSTTLPAVHMHVIVLSCHVIRAKVFCCIITNSWLEKRNLNWVFNSLLTKSASDRLWPKCWLHVWYVLYAMYQSSYDLYSLAPKLQSIALKFVHNLYAAYLLHIHLNMTNVWCDMWHTEPLILLIFFR